MCSYCNQKKETIYHLLIECDVTKPLWTDLQDWLLVRYGLQIQLTPEAILFGSKHLDPLLNFIILITKYEIYRKKFYGSVPQIHNIVYRIYTFYELELYNARLKNTMTKFFTKWCKLNNFLKDFENHDWGHL